MRHPVIRLRTHALLGELLLACAIAAHAHGQALQPTVTLDKAVPGIITIGDGVHSKGTLNTPDFLSGGSPNPAAALGVALQRASSVRFLNGTYKFVVPFTSTRNDIRIEGDPGARFVAQNTNPVGLLDFSGDDVTVAGVEVVVETAIQNQVMIRMAGKNGGVRESKFEVTTNLGTSLAPMILVQFTAAVRKSLRDNLFLPNVGVICVQSIDGNGLSMIGNEISNGVDGGFPEGFATRSCFRGIDLVRDEWCTILGNKFFGLGQPVSDKVESILRYQGGGPSENGHIVINGNLFESIASDQMIDLRGCNWFSVTGNIIGPPTSFPFKVGDAAIRISAEDGHTGGARSGPGMITANDIHNSALDDTEGCSIWLEGANSVSIQANQFDYQRSKYTIRIDSDSCDVPSISGNHFVGHLGVAPAPISPIFMTDEPSTGVYIGGNDWSGYSGPVLTGNPTGNKTFKNGLMDLQDGRPPDAQTLLQNLSTNANLGG